MNIYFENRIETIEHLVIFFEILHYLTEFNVVGGYPVEEVVGYRQFLWIYDVIFKGSTRNAV